MADAADVDVLVVGAGPTGLALAATAHRHGARVRLVDRLADRARESRALAIQPRTLEVLAGLGVTDELVGLGNRAVQLRMHAGRRVVPVALFDIGVADTAYPYLLFLSQAHTERVLGEHLATAGVAVERRVELTGLSDTGDEVRCTLRRDDGAEEAVRARYVVGCDGAHSTVRRLAGIAFTGAAYPQTFVLADLEADGLESGAAHAFLSERGILFFFPLVEPAAWRLLAMRPRTDRTPADAPVTLAEVQALCDRYTPEPVRLHDPVWMTNFRLHNRGADRYRAGRVFLAGDAAHIHSPAGAQGMNTGIQDAANLGWKLALVATGDADTVVLDSYEIERAPIGRNVLRLTDRAFTAATSTSRVIATLRTRLAPRVLPLVLRPRALRARAFRTVSQMAVRYRRSPLSVNGPDAPRRGPKAGDRLPDAPLTRDGKPGTLHEMVAAPGLHLLMCGPTARDQTVAGVTTHRLTPDNQQALRRLGLGPTDSAHFLIRPDGHVAYRAGGTDLTGLRDYLSGWLREA